MKLALTKPRRLSRLKNDQPSSQLTLPNAPLYVVELKKESPLGTGSTLEYAAEPHAGRGSIGTVLVSMNVPPERSGSVFTKAGAMPVHGGTITKPTVGLSIMLFEEKNRYVPSDTDSAGSTDTMEGAALPLSLQVSMRMPGCVATLARIKLPNLPPVPLRRRIIALLTRVERAPAPTTVMPLKAGCERGMLPYREFISAPWLPTAPSIANRNWPLPT